ncbi:Integral membrane protein [Pleurostoma richardsiae]|uniref:Integral membrane protein n=1 Tax=Pleurostoma richardsiae TaxID=41990 RepID=A0AA38VCU2_9PEZI|nr:Integral membrane protein [Pleurostoma richardsiae]
MAEGSRFSSILIANIVLISVATPTVAMKLWVRGRILHRLGWDDALIVVTWILGTALLAVIFDMTRYGLGTHFQDVPPSELTTYLKLTVVVSLTYIWGLITAKASFAFMYMSLFVDRFSKRINRFLIVFLVAEGIEETFVVMFQCNPVRKAWEVTIPGRCISLIKFYYAAFAIKNFTNILIFVQPIPSICRLQMPRAERLILCLMLSLGMLVFVITILRITWLSRDPNDPTYLLVDSLIWSEAEIWTLVICSCLPSLRDYG